MENVNKEAMEVMETINQYVDENVDATSACVELEKEIQLAKIMKEFADLQGTNFHAFVLEVEDEEGNTRPRVYMTNAMIGETTGISDEALKKHFRDENKKEELQKDAGMLNVTGTELKNGINLIGTDSPDQNFELAYPASFGKKGSNSTIVYSDGTEYSLLNRGQNVLSVKSVMLLLSMLTKTEVAKEFRQFVLDKLVVGEVAKETVERLVEFTFEKDTLRLYANDTEKLLEILEITTKHDVMTGVVGQTADMMKYKVRLIDSRKDEFKQEINAWENEINKYKSIDEDLFFEKIKMLENKIEENNRIIQALDTVHKTLLLRLNMINKVVKTLSSNARSTKGYANELLEVRDKINEISLERFGEEKITSALSSQQLNEILTKNIKLIKKGTYAYISNDPKKPLTGYIISDSWTERYSNEFIKSLQSTQERTGNSSDKFIKWTPFGIKLISLLLEQHYLEGKTEKDFLQLSEEEWEKAVYDKYMEEKLAEYKGQ